MKSKKGFSLAELSIVLTIIALISGAVLGGINLYNQAHLRTVIKEIRILNNAFVTFVDIYNAMPGDMKYPPSGWGAVGGNGDNIISSGIEANNVWHHLYNAGLINQVFPSYSSGTNYNFFKSNYSQGLYDIRALRAFAYQQTTKTGLEFGKQNSATASNSVLTPKDASYIDTKIDDGIAATGKLYGLDADDTPGAYCSTWNTNTGVVGGVPVNYNFSKTTLTCRLFYWGDPEWSNQ